MNSPLLLLLLLLFFFPSHTLENEIPPAAAPYWLKMEALFTQARSYLFPPNLDFRGSHDESAGSGTETGPAHKLKEAVANTLGKGKETVHGSAESAANLAKEKMHQLKETLSSPSHHQPQEL